MLIKNIKPLNLLPSSSNSSKYLSWKRAQFKSHLLDQATKSFQGPHLKVNMGLQQGIFFTLRRNRVLGLVFV